MGPDEPTIFSPSGSVPPTTEISSLTIKKVDHVHSSITKIKEPLDDSNWAIWRERIRRIFTLCGVGPYI